ncbi:unnamed protein product [Prunus armeniaca]
MEASPIPTDTFGTLSLFFFVYLSVSFVRWWKRVISSFSLSNLKLRYGHGFLDVEATAFQEEAASFNCCWSQIERSAVMSLGVGATEQDGSVGKTWKADEKLFDAVTGGPKFFLAEVQY